LAPNARQPSLKALQTTKMPGVRALGLSLYILLTNLGRGEPADCGCTTDTLPHPRIVLLGPTGVGKSTFGNRLFGGSGKEALCSQYGRPPYKFGVGHQAESHTNATSWMVGHYLGDPANPCITIIDTPGTGDTEGRDCDHAIALAEDLKKMGSIDAFLLLFKGPNLRFDQRVQEQITLFKQIFGANLFENVITEFTYWSHDARSIRKRNRNQGGLNEERKHQTWNQEYQDKFDVETEIPSVFIDPVYEEEFAEEDEIRINQENTAKLWNLINKELRPFRCDKRCKAPSGFFSGQPWLFEQNEEVNKRLGDRTVITWQIWFAGCDGTGTKSFRIIHRSPEGKEIAIYEKTVQEEEGEIIDDSRLMKSMRVVDEPSAKFKTIRLTIELTEDPHFGMYLIRNEKGESRKSHLKKIVDGEWAAWGAYGDCSKTCISGDEKPGTMQRQRTCKPPQNGGQPCKGKSDQMRTCAHRPGDSQEVFRQCPIDAEWSSWPRDWSECNDNCRSEETEMPWRSRTRVCRPPEFGGKKCLVLENEAKKANQTLYKEKQVCSELPVCPTPASLGPWSAWSTCGQTCYAEGTNPPQRSRERSCKKASLSTDEKLNDDVQTCENLGGVKMYKPCDINACPVAAKWREWGQWTSCSATCSGGIRRRERGFREGRNGADPKPTGDQYEEEACGEGACPAPAQWTWSEWGACDITCYKPDGHRGVRTRSNSCEESSPRHDTLNCDYPPGGFEQTDRPCPGLPQCPTPPRGTRERGLSGGEKAVRGIGCVFTLGACCGNIGWAGC